jgi:hypothetical protein
MCTLDAASQVSLRMGHLGMIESVISRLSSHSATVKNFCLTVSAGVFALAVTNSEEQLLWIAVAAPLLFAFLDAYYLGIERAFRDFYHTVANRPLSEAGSVNMDQETARPLKAFISPTVWPFYVPQSVVALLVIWRGLQ